jgi:hypothetical protein
VQLSWKNLPAGLAGPKEVVLVDAQDKVEVELTAEAAAAPAKLENVVVAGTTLLADGRFTAESAPATLEINKP